MRLLLPILVLVLLAGCATSDSGRTQLVAPDGVGAVLSDLDMRTRLAMTAERACSGDGCEAAAAFRRQVGEVGAGLAEAAFIAYPDLDRRLSRFEFSVPTKAQVGTLSNSGGSVVIFDGLGEVAMDDAALNFVVAREMGHVIGRHHEENTGISIMVSIAAQLLLPVANLIRGAAAAVPVSSSVAATTTAASVVGARVLRAVNRPEQLDEADAIAIKLLRQAGWDLEQVARSVDEVMPRLARIGDDGWIAEFRASKERLDQFDCGAPWAPLPEAVAVAPSDIVPAFEISAQ